MFAEETLPESPGTGDEVEVPRRILHHPPDIACLVDIDHIVGNQLF